MTMTMTPTSTATSAASSTPTPTSTAARAQGDESAHHDTDQQPLSFGRSSTAYPLPRRFDIHQVERVTTEISALRAGTAIDGTDVEMIDLNALAALDRLIDECADLRFVAPSVALRATMTYTGHERLAARCAGAERLATAA